MSFVSIDMAEGCRYVFVKNKFVKRQLAGVPSYIRVSFHSVSRSMGICFRVVLATVIMFFNNFADRFSNC